MTTKLYVQLASDANPDYITNFRGLIEQLGKMTINPLYVPCECLEQASAICQHFIDINGLGGGNFTGGRVVDEQFNFVARISYNGCAWSTEQYIAGDQPISLNFQLFQSYQKQLL